MYVLPSCMSVYRVCLIPGKALNRFDPLDCSCRQLRVAIWMLRHGPGYSGRADKAHIHPYTSSFYF